MQIDSDLQRNVETLKKIRAKRRYHVLYVFFRRQQTEGVPTVY